MQKVHDVEKVKKQDCSKCEFEDMCSAKDNVQSYVCPKGTELWKKLHSQQNVNFWKK